MAPAGRLDLADEPEYGTNVVPLRLGRAELRDGYVRVLNDLYEPEAYFGRLEDLYLGQRQPYAEARARYWRRHPWQRLKAEARLLVGAAGLYARLMRHVHDAGLRREYRRRGWRLLRARRDPALLQNYLIKCALHYQDRKS